MEQLLTEYTALLRCVPKPVPPPPEELVRFRLAQKTISHEEKAKFFSQTFIQEYLEEKWKAELWNRDKYLMAKRLLDGGESGAEKKKEEFKLAILATHNRFKALELPDIALKRDGSMLHMAHEKNFSQSQVEWDE